MSGRKNSEPFRYPLPENGIRKGAIKSDVWIGYPEAWVMKWARSRPYDLDWKMRLENALGLLRVAADRWASRGLEALSVDEVLAVIIHVLDAPGHNFTLSWTDMARELDHWRELVDKLDEKCGPGAARTADKARRHVAVTELREVLTKAAGAWGAASIAEPTPERVLHCLADLSFRGGLTQKPPPPDLGR